MLLYVMTGSLNALETTLKVLLGFPNIVRLPQRLPEMSREPSRSPGKRKEGGKQIQCVYIYILLPSRQRGSKEKRKTHVFFLKLFFCFSPPHSPSPPIYSPSLTAGQESQREHSDYESLLTERGMKERTTAYTKTEYERKKRIMKEKNNVHFLSQGKGRHIDINFAKFIY